MTNQVNIRELILDILMEVTRGEAYSHLVIRSVLEKYQYLEKKDRAFLTRVSEGTIEHMIELDYIIDQFSKVKVKKMKPVIRKALVELEGKPFRFFAEHREDWALNTRYVYPGAIQYWGPSQVCDRTTCTLALEQGR